MALMNNRMNRNGRRRSRTKNSKIAMSSMVRHWLLLSSTLVFISVTCVVTVGVAAAPAPSLSSFPLLTTMRGTKLFQRFLSHNNQKWWTPVPSATPSSKPSYIPSATPSAVPTYSPSSLPSSTPTNQPTLIPSTAPTNYPSTSPSTSPSKTPTKTPTKAPIKVSDEASTPLPTPPLTSLSTALPTTSPSFTSSSEPTSLFVAITNGIDSELKAQVVEPSASPSKSPTISPTEGPTKAPTKPNEQSPALISRVVPLESFEMKIKFPPSTQTSSLDMAKLRTFTSEHIRWHIEESLSSKKDQIKIQKIDLTTSQQSRDRIRVRSRLQEGETRNLEEVETVIFEGDVTFEATSESVVPSTADLSQAQREAFINKEANRQYLISLQSSDSGIMRDTTAVEVTFSPDSSDADGNGGNIATSGLNADGQGNGGNSSGGAPIGAIAGGAATAGLLVLGGVFLLHRRKRRQATDDLGLNADKKIPPQKKKELRRSPSSGSNLTRDMNGSTREYDAKSDDGRSNLSCDFSLDGESLNQSHISLSEAIGIKTTENANGLYTWNNDGTKMLYTAASNALPSHPQGDSFDDYSLESGMARTKSNDEADESLELGHRRVNSGGTAGDGSVWTYDRVANTPGTQGRHATLSRSNTFESGTDIQEGIEIGLDDGSVSILGMNYGKENEDGFDDEFQPDTRILRTTTSEDDDATAWTLDQLSTGSGITGTLSRTNRGTAGGGNEGKQTALKSPDSVAGIPSEISGIRAVVDAIAMSARKTPAERGIQTSNFATPTGEIPVTAGDHSNINKKSAQTNSGVLPAQQKTWKPDRDNDDSDVPFDEMVRKPSKSNEMQRKNVSNNYRSTSHPIANGGEPPSQKASARTNYQMSEARGVNGYRRNYDTSIKSRQHVYSNNQESDDEYSCSSGSDVMEDVNNLSSFLKERRLQRNKEIERREARNGRIRSSSSESGGIKSTSNSSSLRPAQHGRRPRMR